MFLTGQEEIEAMSKTCRDIARHLPDGCPSMLVLPLYASLPYAQQLRVFQGAPKVSAPLSRAGRGSALGCGQGQRVDEWLPRVRCRPVGTVCAPHVHPAYTCATCTVCTPDPPRTHPMHSLYTPHVHPHTPCTHCLTR